MKHIPTITNKIKWKKSRNTQVTKQSFKLIQDKDHFTNKTSIASCKTANKIPAIIIHMKRTHMIR